MSYFLTRVALIAYPIIEIILREQRLGERQRTPSYQGIIQQVQRLCRNGRRFTLPRHQSLIGEVKDFE